MYISLHIEYSLLSLSEFNETLISWTDFRKIHKTNFRKNTSCGSEIVPCGRTDGKTNTKKLVVAFRYFANVPENETRFMFNAHFLSVFQFWSNETKGRNGAIIVTLCIHFLTA